MGYRGEGFSPGGVYHLYSRGVEKRALFLDDHDRGRFRLLLGYCKPSRAQPSISLVLRKATQRAPAVDRLAEVVGSTKEPSLVELLCYGLMPNHVHLLVRENVETGISRYMQKLLNSYARYFNTRHERTGPLFSGPFRSVHVTTTEQLVHVSRYIHLNAFAAGLTDDPLDYPWSSLPEYLGTSQTPGHCQTRPVLECFKDREAYRTFLSDHADYARTLASVKAVAIDR